MVELRRRDIRQITEQPRKLYDSIKTLIHYTSAGHFALSYVSAGALTTLWYIIRPDLGLLLDLQQAHSQLTAF
jgi:hypothetical protein